MDFSSSSVNVMPGPSGNSAGEIPVQKVRIKAKRDIITESGFIKAGQTGWVSKTWIERAVSGGCSCNGSLNWFTFIR